ncbi:MAG: GNAT family N-acetyltransferase [Fimbriimonadia bacterium]
MIIQPIREEHVEAVQLLWDFCFNRGERGPRLAFDQLSHDRVQTFVLEGDGRLDSTYLSIHFDMVYDAHRLPMSGIAGVAVAPAARGRGHAHRMMHHAVSHARERGMLVSMLWAFSLDFYRELGWELVGRILRFELPIREIRLDAEARRVRQVEPKATDTIMWLQRTYASRYRGACERAPRRWEHLLRERNRPINMFVYDGESGPEGYMYYCLPPVGEGKMTLTEMVALTSEAHRGLLGSIRRLDMQIERVEWHGPADDWVLVEPYDSCLEVSILRQPMLRVVNAGALLGLQCREGVSADYTLRVEEPEWAEGPRGYRVHIRDGVSEVVPCAPEDCAVGMTQRTFAQCFMGDPDAMLLRRAGHIEVRDEAAFEAFCKHFPAAITYATESF